MANRYYIPTTQDGQVLFRAEFDDIQAGFNLAESDVSGLTSRMTTAETNITSHDSRIAANETNISTNSTNFSNHLSDPDAHSQYSTVSQLDTHIGTNLHVPAGGDVGQALLKQGTNDYDTIWGTPSGGVEQIGAQITVDAGDSTPHGDLNATDFTGDPNADPTVTTALLIQSDQVVYFGYGAVSYVWTGPKNVTVGIGGSYTAVATDLGQIGTNDHSALSGLTNADSHPQSAIGGRGSDVTLLADQQTQDSRMTASESWQTDHVNEVASPDPHGQYALEVDALSVFSYAAYGGMFLSAQTVFPNITAAYQIVDVFDTLSVATPRSVTINLGSSTFSLQEKGVYLVSISFTMEHNDTTSGRTCSIRLYNTTKAAAGRGTILGTGRNASVTSHAGSILIEISDTDINDEYILQIGNASANYTAVEIAGTSIDIASVGEFRGLLPSDE